MNITVKSDETVRTVRLDVSGADTITRVYQYSKVSMRTFQPDRITITVFPHDIIVHISGPLVLKSGAVSESRREYQYWYEWENFTSKAPAWLISAVREAIGEESK